MVPFSVTVAFSCVDADIFFKNGEKKSPFSNKNGYVWTWPYIGNITTTQQTRIIFLYFFKFAHKSPFVK